jgi:hypothetical protein
MLWTLVRVVDQGRVLLVVSQVTKLLLLDTVYPISVQTVDMEVALAATCVAVLGVRYVTYAVMVLALLIMVLVAVHTAIQVLVQCGVKTITAGTSNTFLIQAV